MNMIDTHQLVENLIFVGFEKAQAEIITRNQLAVYDNLCTKHDLESLRFTTKADIASLKSDIESLRVETKAEIENLRVETKADIDILKHDIENLRVETRANFKILESSINNIKWTVPIVVSIISLCGIYLPKLLAQFGM